MWFWFASSAGLASAADKVLNNLSLRNRGNVLAYSFVYLTLVSIFALVFSFPIKVDITFKLLVLLALQTIFWSLGTVLGFLTHTTTDVSLSMIISRARVIWLIPLGYIFLGERLNLVTLIGIFTVFLGFVLLFYKGNFHKLKGVHLMTASSFFVAIGTIFNTMLVRNYLTPSQVTFVTMFGQSIAVGSVLVYRKNAITKVKKVFSEVKKLVIAAAIIETYAIIGINWSYKLGATSTATTVYLGMSILTVWAGILWLKERDHIWRKIISSAIVTFGIIIVKVFG